MQSAPKNLLPTLALAALIGSAFGPRSRADLIDFEHRPNGATPVDDRPLGAPYAIEGGGTVRFFFDANGNNAFDGGTDILPIFEAVGDDGTDGFVATNGAGGSRFDRARRGYGAQLGAFFLRQPDGIGPVPAPFVIAYDTTQTIREFSGEIWDIDGSAALGTEQWRVDALSGTGAVLASLTSPLGDHGIGVDSLDSLPWNFAFRNLPDGFQSVRLTFVGSKTDGVGLAFNNFSATRAVPEPASLVLTAAGAVALLGYGRCRRRSSTVA